MAETKTTPVVSVQSTIDGMVARAQKALDAFMLMDQKQVDDIVEAMALAGLEAHMRLAKLAIEETKRGVYEDKITKNLYACEYIQNSLRGLKTVGVIEDNDLDHYELIAEPVGVVAGVTPVTNPTSTTIFKCMISLKGRNPIIFGFHPSAQKCSAEAARILRDAAIKAGAPKDCIQWIEQPSIEATTLLMNHPGVAIVLATGGAGMVRSAYSTGKPALGVGPGCVPCYIHKSANLKRACTDLMLSKTFDNGMICASEQGVIVDKEIAKDFEAYMKENNCYFATAEDVKKLEPYVINLQKGAVNPDIVGHSAYEIAKGAGIDVDPETKILICPVGGVGPEHPLSREKLSPVLAYMIAKTPKEGIDLAEAMVEFGGMGHSAVIHATDKDVLDAFASRMKVGRLIQNSPSSHGGIGDIYNTTTPSLTLGCGSYGHNSVMGNVSAVNLLNVKRVAKRRVNMQWFKIPNRIYIEPGATQYLGVMPNIHKVFIVTDPGMVKLGYVNNVLYHLNKRAEKVSYEIFSDVEPNPSVDTVMEGAKRMHAFQPDAIVALGGGSAMDAAKGMWLFYEQPELDFNILKLKFMDIRKRVFKFPRIGDKAKFIAIPTTSGTGSEVTNFAVITDTKLHVKYPITDYELTPDVAIIDPDYVMTLPPSITADTGMDVLTHAIEAYVSVMATDYTDALAIKAIQLVGKNLVKSFKGGDPKAREAMHNASCMAGMAFSNAFLGINHSLAHKLGGEFPVSHGRTNAILLPWVIEYNAKKPDKFATWPLYETFVADEKYADIARALGLSAKTTEEGVKNLVQFIRDMMKEMNLPMSLQETGVVDEKEFLSKLDELADRSYEDQCTPVNPKQPRVTELAEILKKAYYGK